LSSSLKQLRKRKLAWLTKVDICIVAFPNSPYFKALDSLYPSVDILHKHTNVALWLCNKTRRFLISKKKKGRRTIAQYETKIEYLKWCTDEGFKIIFQFLHPSTRKEHSMHVWFCMRGGFQQSAKNSSSACS
jgi:hypothetical protein